MLSEYQLLKIVDLYNEPCILNFFDKEKYVIHYEKVQVYLRLRLKLKRI